MKNLGYLLFSMRRTAYSFQEQREPLPGDNLNLSSRWRARAAVATGSMPVRRDARRSCACSFGRRERVEAGSAYGGIAGAAEASYSRIYNLSIIPAWQRNSRFRKSVGVILPKSIIEKLKIEEGASLAALELRTECNYRPTTRTLAKLSKPSNGFAPVIVTHCGSWQSDPVSA